MSIVYAYGFVRPVERTGLVGLDGDQVGLIARGDVALLGTRLESEDEADPWDGIVAHNRVLTEALEQGPVVPLKVGSLLSPSECERLVEDEYDRVDRLLTRFSGRIEAKVQFTYREQPVLQEIVAERPQLANSGSGYHQRLQAGEEIVARIDDRRRREQPELLEGLAPHAEESALHDGAEMTVLNASFLLARDSQGEFERALGELEAQHSSRMEMKYIAPLPFYSFADAL